MDAPYAGAKAHLVQAVAGANRCRSVWREALGVVTLLGAETDLDVVALLTTSLLVQANRAMLAAGRQVGRDGVSRTRSFRQSFLVAYATRIGERLTTADSAAAAAEDGRGCCRCSLPAAVPPTTSPASSSRRWSSARSRSPTPRAGAQAGRLRTWLCSMCTGPSRGSPQASSVGAGR